MDDRVDDRTEEGDGGVIATGIQVVQSWFDQRASRMKVTFVNKIRDSIMIRWKSGIDHQINQSNNTYWCFPYQSSGSLIILQDKITCTLISKSKSRKNCQDQHRYRSKKITRAYRRGVEWKKLENYNSQAREAWFERDVWECWKICTPKRKTNKLVQLTYLDAIENHRRYKNSIVIVVEEDWAWYLKIYGYLKKKM